MESRFDYWHRQTLREKQAEILFDWKKERSEFLSILTKVEDDLYHICLLNPDIKSNSLVELTKFLARKQ